MSRCTTHRLCLSLLLCLLCLHACNARRIATSDDPNKSMRKLHFVNKGISDVNIVDKPMVKYFPSSKPILDLIEGTEVTVKSTEAGAVNNKKFSFRSQRKGSSTTSKGEDDHKTTTRSDSQASVSWRVPKKKEGIQKQPGFNLDYSPPKTHPPHHN